jgi:hypothetical protein
VDHAGNAAIMTFQDRGLGEESQTTPIEPNGDGLYAISCASTTFCVAADATGNIVTLGKQQLVVGIATEGTQPGSTTALG